MPHKQILITGATSGVGKEMARQLSADGADLVLAVRNTELGKRVADEIAISNGGTITVMSVDTSSQHSIREFARHYRTSFSRLDVLINNAGMNRGAHPRAESVDGIELTFATNVMGYFLLTNELLDLLKSSAPSRLINVASEFASDLDLDDLQFKRRKFESVKAYAQSKACDRLLTWAYARRLKGTGVTANAMTPGLVAETGLYRHSPPELAARLAQRSSRTSVDGADTAVWMATSPDLDGVSGKFFFDRKNTSCEFRNKADEEKLWSICEKLVRAPAE